jgi:transcriptional regulator of heat shock response
MRFKKEVEYKAEELYDLLGQEVVKSFNKYANTIKETDIETLNNRDDLVHMIEEEQPVKYCTFVGLLNAKFDLETVNKLIEIEKKHGNLIESISNYLDMHKSRINIYNESEVQNFILDSVYLLNTYYNSEEQESESKRTM